jgi:NADPH:quinone reductase-like Zn-dependent oxidoreductase
VLVKTVAVALNPVDTKMLAGFAVPGAILGYDFAGTVIAIGSNVSQGYKDIHVGDRVLGTGNSMDHDRPAAGAFAQYVSLPAILTLRIPDSMSFTDTACISTALVCAGLGLFWSMKVPGSLSSPCAAPPAKRPYVLISGGSTPTGTMALQLLKLSNIPAIATCSPKHNALVLSYGAEKVFDYRAPTCAQEIRAYTHNALAYALDCITVASTMKLCYEAIGRAGGRYTALDPFPEALHTRRVIKPNWILGSVSKGLGSAWPAPYGREPEPKALAFAEELLNQSQKHLDLGEIRNHPARVQPGGFVGVLDGIESIRRNEVSGFKLVYLVDDVE